MNQNQTTTEPGSDDGARPLMHLITQVRKQQVSGRNLAIDDRRACVAYFTAEGYTIPEIAYLLDMSDRTIERDRAAIRESNALKPSADLGDQIIGQLHTHAENAIARLSRAVRDAPDGRKALPRERIQAARWSFYVYNRFVKTLLDAQYIETGRSRLATQWLNTPDPTLDPMVEMLTQAMRGEAEP